MNKTNKNSEAQIALKIETKEQSEAEMIMLGKKEIK